MPLFIHKKGSKIGSFTSKNIHTDLIYLNKIEFYPCNLVSSFTEQVYDTETKQVIYVNKKLSWVVDDNCKLISKKNKI